MGIRKGEEMIRLYAITNIARKLYISKLSGQYTVRGFQEALYKGCLEDAEKIFEINKEYHKDEEE